MHSGNNGHISSPLTHLGGTRCIFPASGRASVHPSFVRSAIQVRYRGNACLLCGIYCLHCGRLPLLNMLRRRLKAAAALTAWHPAGMSESPRHAGKPGLSTASLCGEGHETGGSLQEERIAKCIGVQYRYAKLLRRSFRICDIPM